MSRHSAPVLNPRSKYSQSSLPVPCPPSFRPSQRSLLYFVINGSRAKEEGSQDWPRAEASSSTRFRWQRERQEHLLPFPGELPVVILRVQVLGCKNLLAKDRCGFSDPFVVVSLLGNRQQTPVSKRTINPDYSAKDATFDFPIYLSLADKLGVVELVIWDKDVLKKDYLGEVSIPLEDWFRDGNAFPFDDLNNKAIYANVVSTRNSTHATGTIHVKLGFVAPAKTTTLMDFGEVYSDLVKRTRPSLVSAPPTEGIGTIRSNLNGPAYEDDGLSSDEGETNSEEEEEESPQGHSLLQLYTPPAPSASPPEISDLEVQAVIVQPHPQQAVETPSTPTPSTVNKTPVAHKPPSPSFNIPKIFPKRSSTARSFESSCVVSPTTTSTPIPRPMSAQKSKFRKSWGTKAKDFNFSAANDIVGIVMLEIRGATDLPKLKNMTRTGWDMDPFVVISFGKKVFRTRVIRHSLNPNWDEKMLFHVRRYETAFKVQLTVLDWDKLSSNDHVGDASFDVAELVANAPQKDERTQLYPDDEDGSQSMRDFSLPLSTAKEMPWEAKHNPKISFRAKYQPYDALRQKFWRQYLKQYDTDDAGTISHLELTSMLDSLGSTLSSATVNSFFTRFGKKPHDGLLTVNEAIQCLETELCRPASEKKRINYDDSAVDTSAPVTPAINSSFEIHQSLNFDKLDFSGAPSSAVAFARVPVSEDTLRKFTALPPHPTEMSQQLLSDVTIYSSQSAINRQISGSSSDAEDSSGSNGSSSASNSSADSFERVINVKNCPLCHRPRLNSKAEVDIVTHLAVCASQDWASVDKIVVGNFVTASQAQRKWYTKMISKVSAGNYKLGANSANIIVQHRLTGQLEEEKMQVYVRLGIRLLYKGWKSRMEGGRARRLLKSLSIKQGAKYDSPESAGDIPAFIAFHNLKVDEILEPLSSFKTFNEFFYRKLKPTARPIECLDDPYRLVSGADCRLMAFETVNEATRLWIKGREFTVSRLLGEAYRFEAERYSGGALCIFRLAPQDYHRFHSPVDGTIGPMTYITGEYYTVNPQAIRTALDVYGENVRKIVPIDSPQFGRVMAVCIGAMMVGSIHTTVQEGEQVKRGQEFGYFAFGGSTIVVLFEKGAVEFDEDLLINGRACLETLVRVGMGIGRSRHKEFRFFVHPIDTASPKTRPARMKTTAADAAANITIPRAPARAAWTTLSIPELPPTSVARKIATPQRHQTRRKPPMLPNCQVSAFPAANNAEAEKIQYKSNHSAGTKTPRNLLVPSTNGPYEVGSVTCVVGARAVQNCVPEREAEKHHQCTNTDGSA
ncbi:Phosphatidylserine decarboxylase proenzyme 3 [Grifola frondosa]|uniref:Phosphatidylserine decarboxylase proenzyme 2 n=1 Tax=Grifola frondosa TaxID=5627 RepID=A0A1C7LNA3_GRIFR|nr:Phosphatidylserine decarboxylase proenzyme 3 [Grifola frondosa]